MLELKAHLERICGVPQSAQKLIIKGMARDNVTLRNSGIVKGGKVMLVGSKMDDILAVKSAPKVCLAFKLMIVISSQMMDISSCISLIPYILF